MLDTETLAQLDQTSIKERIALIESLLNFLKTDLKLSSEEQLKIEEKQYD